MLPAHVEFVLITNPKMSTKRQRLWDLLEKTNTVNSFNWRSTWRSIHSTSHSLLHPSQILLNVSMILIFPYFKMMCYKYFMHMRYDNEGLNTWTLEVY